MNFDPLGSRRSPRRNVGEVAKRVTPAVGCGDVGAEVSPRDGVGDEVKGPDERIPTDNARCCDWHRDILPTVESGHAPHIVAARILVRSVARAKMSLERDSILDHERVRWEELACCAARMTWKVRELGVGDERGPADDPGSFASST